MSKDLRWLLVLVIITAIVVVFSIQNSHQSIDMVTRVEDAINIEDDDLSIDWNRYQSFNVSLKKSLEITKSGVYHLTGALQSGNIDVRLSDEDNVKLILDNVTISSANGPAIICHSGDNLVIELVGTNTISDSQTYASAYEEDVKGAIFSKIDLYFQGDGTLNLIGNYEDGIISKDDLTFRSGIYNITTRDEGIRGRDSVHIADGNFVVKSTTNAIESTNDVDAGKGFIYIENGNFNLAAGAKGLKSTHFTLIKGGNYALETTDDAIHSDGYIGIANGKINISSADDAIHANRELEVSGGDITIAQSYEGLEAQKVTIGGGVISINASDDGINAGGGNDSSAINRQNKSPFDADENCILAINGGELYVNSSGDGIDSNGWLYINGGRIIVDGPTNNGNGALDSGMGIIMNGGDLIAIGASGMAEALSQVSSLNSLSIFLDTAHPAKTKIELRDQEGNIIFSHTSAKSFSHITAGSSNLVLGNTYYLYLNDELNWAITITGVTTTVGGNSNLPPSTMNNQNPSRRSRPGAN